MPRSGCAAAACWCAVAALASARPAAADCGYNKTAGKCVGSCPTRPDGLCLPASCPPPSFPCCACPGPALPLAPKPPPQTPPPTSCGASCASAADCEATGCPGPCDSGLHRCLGGSAAAQTCWTGGAGPDGNFTCPADAECCGSQEGSRNCCSGGEYCCGRNEDASLCCPEGRPVCCNTAFGRTCCAEGQRCSSSGGCV